MIPLVYLVAGTLVLVPLFWGRRERLVQLAQQPITWFCGLYFLMYFASPAAMIGTEAFRYQSGYAPAAYLYAAAYLLFFGFAVWIGYFAYGAPAQSVGKSFRGIVAWQSMGRIHAALVLTIFLSLSVAALVVVVRVILSVGITYYMGERIGLFRGRGYLFMAMSLPLVLLLLMYTNRLVVRIQSSRGSGGVVVGVLFLMSVIVGALQGSRTGMIIPVAFMVVVRLQLLPPERVQRRWIVGAAGVLLTVAFLGVARQQVMVGEDIRVTAESVQQAAQNILLESGEPENLFWLLDHPERLTFLHGKSFLAAVVGFVPRAIWPSKPLGAGPFLKNIIQPGSYNFDSGVGLSSLTPGLPAEAFMNFGWWGAPIVGVLLGLLLGFLERAAAVLRSPVGYAIWFSAVFCTIFLLKGEALGVFNRFVVMVMPLILIKGLIDATRPTSTRDVARREPVQSRA
jgi:oligosaccharide repeat unit polymerase